MQQVTNGWMAWPIELLVILPRRKSKQTDPPELSQFLHKQNHILLGKGVQYKRGQTQGKRGDPLSAGFASMHTGRSL